MSVVALPLPAARKIGLSKREHECLLWAARGKTYADIAVILDLSFGTVKTYLDSARHKLDGMTLTHAVALALCLGALETGDIIDYRDAPFLDPGAGI